MATQRAQALPVLPLFSRDSPAPTVRCWLSAEQRRLAHDVHVSSRRRSTWAARSLRLARRHSFAADQHGHTRAGASRAQRLLPAGRRW